MEEGLRVRSVCCNDLKMAVFFENNMGQYWRLYNLVDLSWEYQVQISNNIYGMYDLRSDLRSDMEKDVLVAGYSLGLGMQYELSAWRLSTREKMRPKVLETNSRPAGGVKVEGENIYVVEPNVAFDGRVKRAKLISGSRVIGLRLRYREFQ